jgi:hypothetical protein
MPIIIERLTEIDIVPARYRIRINSKEICQFEHNRDNGLSGCLFKAAEAARVAESNEAMDRLVELSQLMGLYGDKQ